MDRRASMRRISACAMARRALIGLIACSVLMFGHPADAAVGRTAGTFAVSPSGAATYTIPIWAPRDPGGVQPHIALTYNSQQGIGFVGVGRRGRFARIRA